MTRDNSEMFMRGDWIQDYMQGTPRQRELAILGRLVEVVDYALESPVDDQDAYQLSRCSDWLALRVRELGY